MEPSKTSSSNPQIGSYAAPSKDLVDMAIAAGNCTTFVSTVKTAGLTGTLKGKGPFIHLIDAVTMPKKWQLRGGLMIDWRRFRRIELRSVL